MSTQPNILFICTDQQRWDTLGTFKPKNLKTPNLDKLLERGIHLSNTFCQAPVCIPSRACMLTGQYPTQTGLYHNTGTLPDDKTTWSGVFSDNGYETLAVGRTHGIIAGFSNYIPIPFGDSFFDMAFTVNSQERKWTYGQHDYRQHPHVYKGDFENYHDVRCVNTACHALHDLKDSRKPWAMYLGILAPHNPYIIPEKYADFYSLDDFDLPVIFEEDFQKPSYVSGRTEDERKRLRRYWQPFTEESIRYTRRMYYSMVTMVDELLGRVLEQLDALGLTDNTIIVFTTDHGEMNGDHARWAKLNCYEASIRVPCIVSYPDLIEGGRHVGAMIEQVDLMPTLLEFAGLNVPSSVAGRSFKSLLEGKTYEHKDKIFSAYEMMGARMRCIRSKRYSLSYGYIMKNGLTGELYDLENDPNEQYNVYDSKEYLSIRNDLLRQLLDCEIEYRYQLNKDRPSLSWRKPMLKHLS